VHTLTWYLQRWLIQNACYLFVVNFPQVKWLPVLLLQTHREACLRMGKMAMPISSYSLLQQGAIQHYRLWSLTARRADLLTSSLATVVWKSRWKNPSRICCWLLMWNTTVRCVGTCTRFSGVVGGMQEERKESNTYLAAQRRRYFEERKGKERNIMHANIQHTDKDISNKAWPIWFAWTKVWGTRLKNKITSKTNSMNNGLFQHSWMVNPSFTFDANYVLNTSLFSMLLTGRRNTVGTYV